ncbi:MAG TPA: cobyric acid synthase [Acidimicrobiales bacterium]|nr:cobyric acid synthase [Acidimicrobiales bacterium]
MTIPPPGPHGDDAHLIAAALGVPLDQVLDLATSLNPVAPDPQMIVAAGLDSVGRYPDTTEATDALAGAIGVDPSQLLLTNGASEAIALVAAEMPVGDVHPPEFSLYERHLTEVAFGAPRWRSNPNNPTGRLAAPTEAAAVWDEAFYQLATGSWTRGDLGSGAVVIGSLTKLFACPGLRLGYVMAADESFIARLAARQPRWAVGGLAAATVGRVLELADLPAWSKALAGLREDLVTVLQGAGFQPEQSDANFVLVPAAGELRQDLALKGIVVRDCANFGLDGAVRIAVPSPAGLERLERALAELGGRPEPVSRRQPETSPAPRLNGALLVCGTASDAGKTQIVAGLCRLLARRGVSVAPFKAQNMSLNSYATASGHEIGRAQALQAMAARVQAEVAMNPVLLKPTGERRSQVVVMGRPVADVEAAAYQGAKRAGALAPVVMEALADLRSRFDVVICEGAGSPAEINLLEGDIANLPLARDAGMAAIVVGDIERGGVFASLFGTVGLLPADLRGCVKAFVINKFRGDASLLAPGIEELERRTGVPTIGVVPWVDGLALDAEDSLGLEGLMRRSAGVPPGEGDVLEVAVVALPHLSNFTDLDALAIEPAVRLRLVASPAELAGADLIVIGGSKATVADLDWLRSSGLAGRLAELSAAPDGPAVLGICAGYQMMGATIDDSFESRRGQVEGLALLPVVTTFEPAKLTRPRRGNALGQAVSGYEIRQGRPRPAAGVTPFAQLQDELGEEPEGAWLEGDRLAGTSLHGLFESDAFRRAYLSVVSGRRGKAFVAGPTGFAEAREAQIDALADVLDAHLDLEAVFKLIGQAAGS